MTPEEYSIVWWRGPAGCCTVHLLVFAYTRHTHHTYVQGVQGDRVSRVTALQRPLDKRIGYNSALWIKGLLSANPIIKAPLSRKYMSIDYTHYTRTTLLYPDFGSLSVQSGIYSVQIPLRLSQTFSRVRPWGESPCRACCIGTQSLTYC